MTSDHVWSLRARWVFPVSGPPIPDGVVTVEGERIVAVGAAADHTPDRDLGNVAVLPGLVNAHTHLDLSGMRGLAPPSPDFTGWLRQVIAHRRARSSEQVQADIQAGLTECLRFGTTLLGDIASEGGSWDKVASAPLRAVVFRELLGLPHDRMLGALSDARNWLYAHPPTATCRPGWSPHAPYSVSAFGFQNAKDYGSRRVAITTHLAESLDERELLEKRTGPFVAFLTDLGVWAPEEFVTGWEDLLRLTAKAHPISYVHANYLPPDAPLPGGSTIIYCPRTHAAFKHPPHPFRDFLARGIRVALGTDSLASNPDLDLLAEARFLRRHHPDVPGATLLRMATLAGAEALGWANETGSLEPGKSADLIVLPLPKREDSDPHCLLFDSILPVEAVLWRGRWVHDAASASS
jgi:aminodeoxyfutalosine deaminase